MRLLVVVVFVVCVALLLSGSGMGAASPSQETVTARVSTYGRILFDGRGFALYAFTRDRAGRSACSGSCATSECRKPNPMTTLPGDACEQCLANAMGGSCASAWQSVCSDPSYAGPAGACDGLATCFTSCG